MCRLARDLRHPPRQPHLALVEASPIDPFSRNVALGKRGALIMVTPAQRTLVQDSFAAIATIADDAVALFYQRLFELDPSLRQMFRGDMTEQRRKLLQMLT